MPVSSGVLKLKNVNKKGLCWQAKVARHHLLMARPFLVFAVDIFAVIAKFDSC